MSVTLDVSKVSGWLNDDALCRVETRAYDARGEVRRAGVWGGGGAQAAFRGKARLKAVGQGTRGAHLEHALHVRDAGGVEAQRLVERRRVLPRVERRAYGAGRGCGPADGGNGVQRAVEAQLQMGIEQAWSAPGTSRACS